MVVQRARTGLSIRTDSTTRLAVMTAARRAGRDLDGLVPCSDSQFLQERKVAVPPVRSERVLGRGRHRPSLRHVPVATPVRLKMRAGGDGSSRPTPITSTTKASASMSAQSWSRTGSKTRIADAAGSPSMGRGNGDPVLRSARPYRVPVPGRVGGRTRSQAAAQPPALVGCSSVATIIDAPCVSTAKASAQTPASAATPDRAWPVSPHST